MAIRKSPRPDFPIPHASRSGFIEDASEFDRPVTAEEEIPVLVLGGSLVGLTTSVLLASHGVRHLLVERHRGTAIHPRAASFHQRTMEIFRSVGLQRAVETAAAREFVQNGAIISVDSLRGRELACFYRSYNEGVADLSPTSRLFITQIGLEPVLRDRARELGAVHHYATEVESVESDDGHIIAALRPRDGGPARTVRARYLVAADGAHSFVRRTIGIGMEGRGSFADCVTIYFKADMRALIGDRILSVVYVNQPGLLAFFRFSITGDAGFLAVFATFDSDGTRNSRMGQNPSRARCAELVRAALGVPAEFPVEIDDVQPWSAAAATATAFRQGHFFLAGDAAHHMPPTGGFGGNTGVADAHNLAWKLAWVLKGQAGARLLDTYETERKPLCELIVEQAYTRYIKRVDSSLPATNLAPALDDAAIELGSVYRSAAVIDENERPGDGLLEDPRHPSGRPGTRLPHVTLQRGNELISTLDLTTCGFTLIVGVQGHGWADAAAALAGAGHALKVCRVGPGAGLSDPHGRFGGTVGIGSEGALLLRPDGVIAWRAAGICRDAPQQLASAMSRVTFRD
jgi:2-polyprenyl-6-methoxyphenol hydroxylase-like FAD-dependent oxidoreductase